MRTPVWLFPCSRTTRGQKWRSISPPNGFSLGHCKILAYSMQCSGSLGIEAMVHIGKLICGLQKDSEALRRSQLLERSVKDEGRGRTEADLRRIQLQCAFDTSSHARQDDSGISFEAFSPSINEGDDGAGVHHFIFIIEQGYLKITAVTDNYRLHAYIGSRSGSHKT